MTAGHVYWITGISGVGKSTLADLLHTTLRSRGSNVILLDGDVIRELLLDDSGFDRTTRLKIAKFNSRLCRFLSRQGMDVVCSTISLFHEVQEWNRKHIEHYIEIFLDAPMQVLKERDPKRIYQRATAGELTNVVGMDIAAEFPKSPEFTFITDGRITAQAIVETILTHELKDAL